MSGIKGVRCAEHRKQLAYLWGGGATLMARGSPWTRDRIQATDVTNVTAEAMPDP